MMKLIRKLFLFRASQRFLTFLPLNLTVWYYAGLEYVASSQILRLVGFIILLSTLMLMARSLESKFTTNLEREVIYLPCHRKIFWKILFVANFITSVVLLPQTLIWGSQFIFWSFLALPVISWLVAGLMTKSSPVNYIQA